MLHMLTRPAPPVTRIARRAPWWSASIVGGVILLALVGVILRAPAPQTGTPLWWLVTLALHAPFFAVLLFLVAGTVERLGFLRHGRTPRRPGALPAIVPAVCVQVPLFNEDAVAARIVAAVGALRWPDERLEIQVLDDSTDAAARATVEHAVAALRARRPGLDVQILHRVDRQGYKAGALEAGRTVTAAEFIAIFDADFLPTPDFLTRTVPHFYDGAGNPDDGLALVQAQWGHLNPEESALTRAQALWVDDHHTVQMSWRAARWGFVNFTGTAGVWRASAIGRAGGWRAASLVEDCELSFRHLFAGFRTTFVRDVVAPAELPATYTAYKAQQRRWTQGWAQVQRLHLATLVRRYETTPPRRLHLIYHMGIPWQWPLWAMWIVLLPALIHAGLWFGGGDAWTGFALYLAPMLAWTILATVLAAVETPGRGIGRRLLRVLPYVGVSTGMLPHQVSAFVEGLAGPMHSEFERTPKKGAGTARVRSAVRIHWPYVVTEGCFLLYQLTWGVVFLATGAVWPALGALFVAACIATVGFFYGDNAGRVLFVVDPAAVRAALTPRHA